MRFALVLATLAAVSRPPPASPDPLMVPLPPPRPEEDGPALPVAPHPVREGFGPPAPPIPPAPPAPPEPDLACAALLAGGTVVARAEPPIPESGGCGIAAPVRLSAVVLRDGRTVPLSPPALMRCDFAEALANWLRDDVVAATEREGDLLGVADAAAYACRSRNRQAGARISEHARGNAIDILGLRFARRSVTVDGADARDVWGSLRASACARFSTVLGPGSDAFHQTDLHLDLEHRRGGYRLCQWDVP